jgi:hypothetical protein
MKNYFVILPLVALITACGTTKDDYQKRAEAAEEKREAQVTKSISRSPAWMTELPASDSAVFANGSAVSTDMSMADYKAKLFAFGKICMAAGGKVDQQSKIFMQDTAVASTEVSELAIRSMCPSVDITGTEIREVKRIAEGGRFRTYVLLALPTGEANALQKRKDQLKLNEGAVQRGTEAFKELDRNAEPAPVKATPTVQLYPDTTLSPGERVVIKETLN